MILRLYIGKGRKFFVVDALSRKNEKDEVLLCALSILQEDW
jgi:hypothetical protein